MAKVEVNSESLVTILNQVKENIQEERGLALDRYKRQDDNLDTDDQFALQGKILCDLLKIAAERSNALLNMGRMIAGIVYKDAALQNSDGNLTDDEIKKEIQRQINDEMGNFDSDVSDAQNKS